MSRGQLAGRSVHGHSDVASPASAFLVPAAAGFVSIVAAVAALALLSWGPEMALLLPIGAVVVAALLYRPAWALPAFLALTWAGLSSEQLGGLPSPIEAASVALLALAAWNAWTRGELRAELAALCALLGLPLIAAALLSPEGVALPADGLKELVFLVITALCLRTVEDVDRVAVALAGVGLVLGLGAVFSVAVEPTVLFPLNEMPLPGEPVVEAPRAAGPFGEANFFALSLAALAPIALYLVALTGPRRVLGLAAGVALLAGVLATGSRGGLLAGAFAVIAFGAVAGVRRLRVGAVVFVLVGLVLLPLFSTQASSATERTVSGRQTENAVAIAMFLDHPVAGVGPRRYPDLYREYSREIGNDLRLVRDPHSLPLEIAAEQGLVGLMGWLAAGAVIAQIARRSRLLNTLLGKALVLSVLTYLLTSLFLHGSRLRLLYVLVGLLLVLGSALSRERGLRPV